MGVCEEDGMLHLEKTMNKEKSEDITRKIVTNCQKNRAESLLILVIILLMMALINVWTRPTSCHLYYEVGEDSIITRAPEIPEIKSEKSAPCDDDWIWYRGKCYYFSTQSDTWRNSDKFCNSHNSSLAIVESKEELDFMFQYKGTDNHWIGMRRTDDNTAWTWTDGTLYNESLFKIRRKLQENTEHVYLNSGIVGSDGGNFRFKWICNKE
ncbi:C-type lectin domain family 2 member A-like isoform X2 [Ranitomeya variabilis]|uniref:C-type lectin domain family 2 member A-like isoform X2 n=1 Tax=Ranitomeya variabilis TaxID=490064 RepID=UPI004055C79E